MFQGSRHVAKAEHIALVQAAGGTMNGTTWLDRTNYFETVPSHQLELALWLEADRLGTLLDALSRENLDNQRAVVKNEKRLSYDNQPYGTWQEKLLGHLYPPDHPYHHPTIGSMEDLDAASLEDVSAFFRTWYAPNNAVLSIVGDVDPEQARAWVEKYFGAIPANPAIPPFAAAPLPLSLGGERRETVEDRVPLPRTMPPGGAVARRRAALALESPTSPWPAAGQPSPPLHVRRTKSPPDVPLRPPGSPPGRRSSWAGPPSGDAIVRGPSRRASLRSRPARRRTTSRRRLLLAKASSRPMSWARSSGGSDEPTGGMSHAPRRPARSIASWLRPRRRVRPRCAPPARRPDRRTASC